MLNFYFRKMPNWTSVYRRLVLMLRRSEGSEKGLGTLIRKDHANVWLSPISIVPCTSVGFRRIAEFVERILVQPMSTGVTFIRHFKHLRKPYRLKARNLNRCREGHQPLPIILPTLGFFVLVRYTRFAPGGAGYIVCITSEATNGETHLLHRSPRKGHVSRRSDRGNEGYELMIIE